MTNFTKKKFCANESFKFKKIKIFNNVQLSKNYTTN